MTTKLHYIFDPLCGWCYATSPLMAAIDERFGDTLELVFHPGLLFEEPKVIEPFYREHIIAADGHIAKFAGVTFGDAYTNRVRTAPVLRYHSELPAAAVKAAQALDPSLGLRMLEAIQLSHYQQGKDVGDIALIKALAQSLGLDPVSFELALNNSLQSLPGLAQEARNLMHSVGGQGFPTLVLERDGELEKIDHVSAYGKPDLFSHVTQLIG